MSAPDDWYQAYQRRQEDERRYSEQLVAYLLPVLRFLGVRRMTITYDGYGDDGELEDLVCEGLPAEGLPEGLERLVEEACENGLPGSWEINEGSFGTWEIDVAQGRANLDHTWREEEDEEEEDEVKEDEEKS
jgi:hypothetical protein